MSRPNFARRGRCRRERGRGDGLLRAGAQPDVNAVSLAPKRSALYAATVCGHEEVARRLIQAGADVTFEDPVDHGSVLHEACCGSEQLVNDLLTAGANPESDFGPAGCTPLHQAAGGGRGSNVSALLLRGGNRDALDHDGGTPLIWAAGYGQLAGAEILLAAGADCNIRNFSGFSALDMAACEGHVPVLKAILRHGADMDSQDLTNAYSALHKAAIDNQAEAIDALVEAGADIELMSNEGETPLIVAAYHSCSDSMLALLERGADATICDEFEYSPLHKACLGKRPGLEVAVDLLLRWGADETAWNNSGQPPANVLDEIVEDGENRCSQEEVQRVRLLLARAPADRAWRRRGWLLMLRSRASKANEEGRADDNESIRCAISGASVVVGGGGSGKPHRPSPVPRRVERSRGGQACDGDESGRTGVGVDGGDLSRLVVLLLLGLELEGVFRTVVGFL